MDRNLLLKLISMVVDDNSTSSNIQYDSGMIGKKVIVRCRDAGVHYGELASYNGRECVLKSSRRMWYWKAKSGHSLSGCAVNGIDSSSKITATVKNIILPEFCEIIECERIAIETIEGAIEYEPK